MYALTKHYNEGLEDRAVAEARAGAGGLRALAHSRTHTRSHAIRMGFLLARGRALLLQRTRSFLQYVQRPIIAVTSRDSRSDLEAESPGESVLPHPALGTFLTYNNPTPQNERLTDVLLSSVDDRMRVATRE